MTMQGFPNFNPENPFLRFLESDIGRRSAFFAQPGVGGGGGFGRERFFQNLFPQIENRFLGQLGQQTLGGGAPTLTFTDFLGQGAGGAGGTGGFNANREFLRAPNFQTGRQTQGLVSPTRFLFQGR